MSELDLDEELLDNGTTPRTHGGSVQGGLLALCILTLVGSGLILIKDFFTYSMYTVAENAFGQASRFSGAAFDNPFRNIGWVYFIEVVSCLGTITGAILMMKKMAVGFPIWLISTGLYIIEIIWFYFFMLDTQLDAGAFFVILIFLAGPIVFIPLYATHRKYMTN